MSDQQRHCDSSPSGFRVNYFNAIKEARFSASNNSSHHRTPVIGGPNRPKSQPHDFSQEAERHRS